MLQSNNTKSSYYILKLIFNLKIEQRSLSLSKATKILDFVAQNDNLKFIVEKKHKTIAFKSLSFLLQYLKNYKNLSYIDYILKQNSIVVLNNILNDFSKATTNVMFSFEEINNIIKCLSTFSDSIDRNNAIIGAFNLNITVKSALTIFQTYTSISSDVLKKLELIDYNSLDKDFDFNEFIKLLWTFKDSSFISCINNQDYAKFIEKCLIYHSDYIDKSINSHLDCDKILNRLDKLRKSEKVQSQAIESFGKFILETFHNQNADIYTLLKKTE